MKKTYFAKYLPAEGEIKDGDLVLYTGDNGESLRMRYVGVYDKNNFDDKHIQLLKLFLCSRDIFPNDVLTNPETGKIEDLYSSDKPYVKVIGEISANAVWVKEGDVFEEDDYYECKRCSITSDTPKCMCPCPRGGCEAKIKATKTTITTTSFDSKLSSEQKKWNKNR
jgi:hypothetical protein